MKVEDSTMAEALALEKNNPEDQQPSSMQRVTSGPERLIQFLHDVRAEMRKVVTPTRAEVRSTTIVVICTVFIFAAFFELVDVILGTGIDQSVYIGTPVEKWGDKEWLEFGIEGRNWMLSQFLHGEQGALICTAKIVETVPWYDAKLYASTQVMDEARHVEVFARYLQEKLGGQYQVNSHLRMLLDDIVNDSRWDMTYLGMQVMVEGLALAAFGFLHQITGEPLLKQLLRYVMSYEARHVAFGVLSLKEVYDGMSDAEIMDRQEFTYEAAIRMRDRFMQQEVWERMGIDMRQIMPLLLEDPTRGMFQQMLFSKIVPNTKKLGLLDRNGKWLRHKFEEMGVIQFEDWVDTGEEYAAFELGGDAPEALPAA